MKCKNCSKFDELIQEERIKQFNKKATEIIINILVSILTTIIVFKGLS